MEELLSYLRELRADNADTGDLLRVVQARDEKEKADIAATVRVFTSWWEKHHPGEELPPEVAGSPSQINSVEAFLSGSNLAERVRQNLAAAFEQMPTRFTTKELFPLVPEIHSEEVPDSQGYDFLRKQVEDGKLWVYQQGAGRRATTYSKEPVPTLPRPSGPSGVVVMPPGVNFMSGTILKAVEPLPNPAVPPPLPPGIR